MNSIKNPSFMVEFLKYIIRKLLLNLLKQLLNLLKHFKQKISK